ncbi:cytochrome P450 87A3-like [Lycium ferocissimum]|uniref:cytochrome P450 87A3-like n=1 Tax=Lycium ferocissimum TaxID=112874 RepID=UPI0028158993|nr:cytochrome P450 87A3-like [Lycium ferocissimum]
MWNIIGLWAVGVIVIGISHWVYKWKNPKCRGILPPGSMGLPIIGESFQYFSSHSYQGIPPFIAKRTARYGTLFKTSVLGQPVVISTDPEINHYVFQQEEKLFRCWYTKSAIELTGMQGLIANDGVVHKYLRSFILSLIGPERLKRDLLSEIDLVTRKHLHCWARRGEVDIKEAAAIMLFIFFAGKILGCDEQEALELREHYKAFYNGFLSFPINVPGTAFHACLQGRKNAVKVIKDIFKKRKLSKEKRDEKDFLDYLFQEVDNDEALLTEAIAVDAIFLLIFAAYETTSSSITLLLKHLKDRPDVLGQLMEEHGQIRRNRVDKDAPISWVEYKSMTFTQMVTNETVRLANIVPGIFRIVLKDVDIKGYTIPAGWIFMVCPSSVHLDPTKYASPLTFNPWRWKDEELHSASKKFMAFGGGMRLCVGADLSKVQTSIFLYYLLKNYSWNVINDGNIIRQPGLIFKKALRIQIREIQRENDKEIIA